MAQEDTGLNKISKRNWPEKEERNMFINRSIPIDGIYAVDDIEDEINMLSLSFCESAGDHKTVIIEISTRATIGQFQSNIVRPSTRHLTTKQPVTMDSYNVIVEEQFKRHRIVKRLEALPRSAKHRHRIGFHAEPKCRKLLKPNMEFSPTIQYW